MSPGGGGRAASASSAGSMRRAARRPDSGNHGMDAGFALLAARGGAFP